MTPAEKIALLESKAADLINWFKQKPEPVPPFQLNGWTVVNDCRQYFKTQLDRIAAHKGNPYNKTYINAYQNLLELKNYMQNVTANNGEPPALQKISPFRNRAEGNTLALAEPPNNTAEASTNAGSNRPGHGAGVDIPGTMCNDRPGLAEAGPGQAKPNPKKQQKRKGGRSGTGDALPGLFS